MKKFAKLAYGRLHRDVLKLAIDESFSKAQMRIYSWVLVNANPLSGELYENPSIAEVAKVLDISKRQMYYALDALHEMGVYLRDAEQIGMKGTAPHLTKGNYDPIRQSLSNLIVGYLPCEAVRIFIKSNLKPTDIRLYWWITLNVSADGSHLTRLETFESLTEILGIRRRQTLLASLRALEQTGLFERHQIVSGRMRC